MVAGAISLREVGGIGGLETGGGGIRPNSEALEVFLAPVLVGGDGGFERGGGGSGDMSNEEVADVLLSTISWWSGLNFRDFGGMATSWVGVDAMMDVVVVDGEERRLVVEILRREDRSAGAGGVRMRE